MKYISDKGLAERWGTSRETPWKWARTRPDFPQPVKLSAGCTRWVVSEIEEYEAGLRAATKALAASRKS